MIKSMTGFGQVQYEQDGYNVKVEIKSVNHRFMDVNIRMPRRYMLLEERVQRFIKEYASRGRFDLNIQLDAHQQSSVVNVDKVLALSYYNALKELAETVQLPAEITIKELVRLPEVLQLQEPEENLEQIWEILQVGMKQAMQQLLDMRICEGERLKVDIASRLNLIEVKMQEIESRSPLVVENHRIRLEGRIKELLPDSLADPQRIIQETALFADKICVAEEVTRMYSHIQQFRALLAQGDAIGRKSDFLLQEMFREVNTTASKANDTMMTSTVVDIKAELEKIREQIQNVE